MYPDVASCPKGLYKRSSKAQWYNPKSTTQHLRSIGLYGFLQPSTEQKFEASDVPVQTTAVFAAERHAWINVAATSPARGRILFTVAQLWWFLRSPKLSQVQYLVAGVAKSKIPAAIVGTAVGICHGVWVIGPIGDHGCLLMRRA